MLLSNSVDVNPGYTGSELREAAPLRGTFIEGEVRKLWPPLLRPLKSRARAKSAKANAIAMTRHRMVLALIYLPLAISAALAGPKQLSELSGRRLGAIHPAHTASIRTSTGSQFCTERCSAWPDRLLPSRRAIRARLVATPGLIIAGTLCGAI